MNDSKLDAVVVARAFEVMLPNHKAGLQLTHNAHKDVYKTVQQIIDEDDGPRAPLYCFVSDVERQKAIATNELWTLQWYPDTPIGFFHVKAAATLSALAQWLQNNGLAFGS